LTVKKKPDKTHVFDDRLHILLLKHIKKHGHGLRHTAHCHTFYALYHPAAALPI
jgi:hypothetical protein